MKIIWCIMSFMAILSCPALAEGTLSRTSGEYGINRRVNTEATGYIGVQGTFHASITETPPLVRLSEEDEAENPFENANHYKSTPTCYLGSHLSGQVSKQVDAGLQYYNTQDYYPHSKHLLQPGWGAFINAGVFVTPKKGVKGTDGIIRWEGYRDSWTAQSNIDYRMQYKINTTDHKGFVILNVNGGELDNVPEFTWSNKNLNVYLPTSEGQKFPTLNDGNSVYLQSEFNTLAVKRVLGMTQGNVTTYELDGSAMTGTFKEGQVFKIGGEWVDWPYDIVAQGETGYDVDENAKDAKWGDDDTLLSQYILTFPNIQDKYNVKQPDGTYKTFTLSAGDGAKDARYNADPSKLLLENDKSRYTEETIKISLRSATKITGKKSEPRDAS